MHPTNSFSNAQAWAKAVVTNAADSSQKTILVCDIDDTVLDSTKAWHMLYLDLCKKAGLPQTQRASMQNFTQNDYRQYFEKVVSNYDELKQDYMHSSSFHKDMALTPAFRASSSLLLPLISGFLTTRPDVIASVTTSNLRAFGISAPVLLRDQKISYQETINYKALCLNELQKIAGSRCVVYVDDHQELVNKVKANLPNVIAIKVTRTSPWRKVLQQLSN